MNFSLLMSVYNKENPNFFDSALESNLINQTLKPNEFVLVCDGPLNDEIDAVIEKYVSLFPEIMAVYRLPKNEGLGKALNFGIEKCRNEIIVRADSDDISAFNRFEKQMAFLEKNKDIAVFGSSIEEFIDDYTKSEHSKKMPLTDSEIRNYIKRRNPINHMTVVFKKSMIEKIGSYMPMPYLEDYYLWVRAAAGGYKFANMEESLVYARVGNGMIKRRGRKEQISGWKTIGKYMLEKKMITKAEYIQNVIAINFFVHMPSSLKELSYRFVLRK